MKHAFLVGLILSAVAVAYADDESGFTCVSKKDPSAPFFSGGPSDRANRPKVDWDTQTFSSSWIFRKKKMCRVVVRGEDAKEFFKEMKNRANKLAEGKFNDELLREAAGKRVASALKGYANKQSDGDVALTSKTLGADSNRDVVDTNSSAASSSADKAEVQSQSK